MKTCKACLLHLPLAQFHPHKQIGHRNKCKGCTNAQAKHWYEANKERKAAAVAAWQEANRGAFELARAAWKKSNPEKLRGYTSEWQKANRPKINAYKRAQRHVNPASVVKYEIARRAAEKRACVRWANPFFIGEIYHLSKLRTKVVGVRFVVDHMVPLRHPLVCGLHVEHNLEVIENHLNEKKGNRWWPDMWEEI